MSGNNFTELYHNLFTVATCHRVNSTSWVLLSVLSIYSFLIVIITILLSLCLILFFEARALMIFSKIWSSLVRVILAHVRAGEGLNCSLSRTFTALGKSCD